MFNGKTPTNKNSELPTPETVHAPFAARQNSHNLLTLQSERVNRELMASATSLRERGIHELPPLPTVDKTATEKAERIARLLDENPGEGEVELPQEEAVRFRELDRQRDDLKEAIAKSEQLLLAERARASVLLCEALEGHHATLVRDLCNAMVALHTANRAYTEFADRMNEQKVFWSALKPQNVWFLDGTGPNSNIAIYLKEAVRDGFLKKSDLPEDLRR